MGSRILFAVLFLALAPSLEGTPLDDYVAKPDAVYSWSTIAAYPDNGVGYSQYLINMTSQRWQTLEETNQPIWWHYLIVVVPTNIRFTDSVFLTIDNGNMDDEVPTPSTDHRFNTTAQYALATGSISVDLKMIPNQRLHCAGDPPDRLRREDDLIAWTWRQFLDDPSNPEILLQLPMAKAGVRAIDTIIDFAKTLEPSYDITSFLVAGGSKRGWTTYLIAAAAEPGRVFAIIPEVLTCLNFISVMRHQYRAYGGWSFSNKDYYNENITADLEHPNMVLMTDIIDPYVYRDRLTMPKLLVSGSGDEHFMPDDTHYFWNDLTGTKYYWMLENSGHNIGDSPEGDKILPNEVAFYLAVKTNFQLPQISWLREETTTGGSITVTTDTEPIEISAVYADTNDELRRDYRMHNGILDPSSPVPSNIVWTQTFNVEMVVLDMTENELDMLARHLGHDTKTHKDFYRLSHHTLELSKVSQLLLAVESGNVNEWKGRKLEDISTEDLPDVECADDEDDDDGSDIEVDFLEDASTFLGQEADMNINEESSKVLKTLSKASGVATMAVIPEFHSDQDDTASSSDNFSKQRRRYLVEGKKLPWSAPDLTILKEASRGKTAPLSFNEIRCLQALHPSLKRRSLAQIKSRAWALKKR